MLISWPPMLAVALAGGLLGGLPAGRKDRLLLEEGRHRRREVSCVILLCSGLKTAGRGNGNDCRTKGCGWGS